MNWDFIQTVLLIWLIERVSIERARYKLAIDTNGGYQKGYWSIWIYYKGIYESGYGRAGGKRLIHFRKYIIPKLG